MSISSVSTDTTAPTIVMTSSASTSSSSSSAPEPTTLKGVFPELPKWMPKETLDILNQYVGIDPKERFRRDMCRTLSPKLGFALMSVYNGARGGPSGAVTDFTCKIDGRAAALTFVNHYHWTEHCYLKLAIDGETWIIDPTWKQFAFKRNTSELGYDPEDSYNKFLLEECPDIFIGKREDIENVLQQLRLRLESQGASAVDVIGRNQLFWDFGRPDGEFTQLVNAIADPVYKATLVSKYSLIPGKEKYVQDGWESLQKSIGVPLDTIQKCAQKALGLAKPITSADERKEPETDMSKA